MRMKISLFGITVIMAALFNPTGAYITELVVAGDEHLFAITSPTLPVPLGSGIFHSPDDAPLAPCRADRVDIVPAPKTLRGIKSIRTIATKLVRGLTRTAT